MKGKKKGFSLMELLTVIVIMLTLSGTAVISYKTHKKKSEGTWVKSELANIAQIMEASFMSDGGYHQFIYQAGYRPIGDQLGIVGASGKNKTGDKACCTSNDYDDLTASPTACSGGHMHYNCKITAPHNAATNIAICNSSSYDKCENSSSWKAANLRVETTSGHDCEATKVSKKAWCNCDEFTLAGKTRGTDYFTLNNRGVLCYREGTSGTFDKQN